MGTRETKRKNEKSSEHDEGESENVVHLKSHSKCEGVRIGLLVMGMAGILEVVFEELQLYKQLALLGGIFGVIFTIIGKNIFKDSDAKRIIWRPRKDGVSFWDDIIVILRDFWHIFSRSTATHILIAGGVVLLLVEVAACNHVAARLRAGVKAGVDAFVSFEEKDQEEENQEEDDKKIMTVDTQDENKVLIKRF